MTAPRWYDAGSALQLLVTFRGLMRFRITARRQLIRIQLPISTAAGRGGKVLIGVGSRRQSAS
jgi:hypothetical protein